MKSKNVGLMVLALALGTAVHAEDVAPIQKAQDLNQVKELVESLEISVDQADYDSKIVQIKNMLDLLTKEDRIQNKNDHITCRSSL